MKRITKSLAATAIIMLALGLTGCKAAESGTYDDKIESGTVCIDGYRYAWSSPLFSQGFDMEPTGQFCDWAHADGSDNLKGKDY